MRKYLIILIISAFAQASFAQDALAPLNRDYYHLMDRLDIAAPGEIGFHTSHKPYRRSKIFDFAKSQDAHIRSSDDEFRKIKSAIPFDSGHLVELKYLPYPLRRNTEALTFDNWEYIPSTWSTDSQEDSTAYTRLMLRRFDAPIQVITKNFVLSGAPVLGFAKTFNLGNKDSLFQNTRGLQVRGSVGEKLGFYTFISENQFRFPTFYRNQIDTQTSIPGVGFFKKFKNTGHDFFTARGYVTFSPIEEIQIQFGHDQNFIGDGFRSLIWSDQAKENLFLKFQTEVWRFRYLNIFSELADVDEVIGNGSGFQKKYSAFHHLNYQITPDLHVGVFEHVIFARGDSSAREGYDLNYLNPLIFYRAVEHGLNSSDNVILGMNWKWNFLRHFSFYGQVVLDEFKKDELINRTGWWGNKWGVQSGVKYINAFTVPNLDLQYEANIVRPYTYTHITPSQNYSNYIQPMAHPLGANFKEHIFIARYGMWQKLFASATVVYSTQGLDSASNSFFSYGSDISKSYTARPQEDGIKIGDGVKNSVISAEIRLSRSLVNQLFVDVTYLYRKQDNAMTGEDTQNYLSIGLRYFLPHKLLY